MYIYNLIQYCIACAHTGMNFKNKTFEVVMPYSLAEMYRHFRGRDVVGLSKMSVQFCQTARRHIRCNNMPDY